MAEAIAMLFDKIAISCEMVGFNDEGQVYLVQRPSLVESPDEPYPEKWHAPSSGIEPYEGWEDVFVRIARKFGERVVFDHIIHVETIGYPPIVHDPPRGSYLLQIFIARIVGVPTNPRGRFFPREQVFQLDTVRSYMDVIFPAAVEWYDAVGFGMGKEVYDLTTMKGR